MIQVDDLLLRKIIQVVDQENDFHQLKTIIAQQLLLDFNHQLIDGFPHRLIIKTTTNDEIIVLTTLVQQNILLDSLFSHFAMIQNEEMCEDLNEVRNLINSVN